MPGDPKPQAPTLPLVDNGVGPAQKVGRQQPATRRHSRFRLPAVILASAFFGGVAGLYFQPPGLKAFFETTGLEPGAGTDTPIAIATQQVMSQEEIAVVSEGDVVALGRILPQGDVVSIATPYGAGDARISELRVSVGDQVAAGHFLAVLDNKDELDSAVDAAKATLAIRRATLEQTRSGIAASLAEAQAALERSQVTAAEAASELARAQSLLDRGVLTRADFDQASARADEAKRDVESDIATLSRYAVESDVVQADIAVAQANVEAAQVEVIRSERSLAQAVVSAPADGTILRINSRVGERPDADGILDMGDTSQMTVEAEVYQTLIGRVAIGNSVTISAAALDGDLIGTVHAIGLEIGRQTVTSDDPAANTDARVVDVIVWLDAASSLKAARFTNLETVVRIQSGTSR